MTNQSPPESPNSMPERRRRPVTGVTFDEMIAIIVAFSTIGAILFWAIGGKNSKLAGNLGDSSLLALGKTSDKTNDTGIGFGNILSQDSRANTSLSEQELEAENRRLATQIKEQDSAVVYIPPNKQVELPAKVAKSSIISLDSGAKLVPIAGIATLPALKNRSRNIPPIKAEDRVTSAAPPAIAPTVSPQKTTPEKVKPEAKTPKITQMPKDVAPDYWAYSFIKQMRDKKLVPELSKNQEFNPDVLITRASMATFVSEAFKQQPTTKNVKQFNDVSNKNEIAQDIDRAVRTGFMQGYSDQEFKPLENISRYQVLVTLATGLGLQPSKDADQILQQFGDRSKLPDWAKQQVAAATEAGLVVNPPGVEKGSLDPQRAATRAEVVAMIHQALVKTGKIKPIESKYIVKP